MNTPNNYELPPMLAGCASPALLRRYRAVVDSVEPARVTAYWLTHNRGKRKSPFPFPIHEPDPKKPHIPEDYREVLKEPCELWRPRLQTSIMRALDYEDREFFIQLGQKLGNPPVKDPFAENRQFLLKHWLVLTPSRISIVETGEPGESFPCGLVPLSQRKGNRKFCRLGQYPARPIEELPGLCWFSAQAIAEFHAALPGIKARDEKHWANLIERTLKLKRPRLILVREGAVKRKDAKVTIYYQLPRARSTTPKDFPLFPEDSKPSRSIPTW